MTDCPNIERNLEMCNCTYDCSRKGMCCECIANHRQMGQFPACFFSDNAEATYDRSFKKLKQDRD